MKRTLVALLVLGLAPLVASAATITWSLQYMSTYTVAGSGATAVYTDVGSKFALAGNTLTAATGFDTTNYVNRFKVMLRVSGVSDTDVLTLACGDLKIGQTGTNPVVWSHLTPQTGFPVNLAVAGYPNVTGWTEKPAYWNNDPTNPKPVYTRLSSFFAYTNAKGPDGATSLISNDAANGLPGDLGDPNDLIGLRANVPSVDTDGAAWATGVRPGVDNNLTWGYVYLKWDGSAASLSIQGGPLTGVSWGTAELGNNLGAANSTMTGSTLNIAALPEPATMALLVLGGLSMLARRRRA
jgi:hypothetical protein